MIKVLEVIDSNETQVWSKRMCEGITNGFIGMKNITLNMDFSFACTHHKLNFEVHRSKTGNFMDRLCTML